MPSYFLYTDESSKKGKYYNNFYGGILVPSKYNEIFAKELLELKAKLNITSEMKWQKITKNYQSKYCDFVDHVFNVINNYNIKIRIMFTHNYIEPINLTKDQKENEYFLLYYQFIKHAFGLRYHNEDSLLSIILMMDQLPDTKEKCDKFKSFISEMNKLKKFRDNNIEINKSMISEIDSSKHVQSQALDIILGAMQFRLNDKHKEKSEGQNKRGSRTIAKENVYKHIRSRIVEQHPNFNIGISTGKPNGLSDLWNMPYRHWKFQPTEYRINKDMKK